MSVISEHEAAKILGCSTQTLRNARCLRTGAYSDLPYVKAGGKVGYQLSDLEAYIQAHKITPTEPAPKAKPPRAAKKGG